MTKLNYILILRGKMKAVFFFFLKMRILKERN